MASSSSNELLLASSPDGRITAYDASTGSPLAQFAGSRTPRRGLTIIAQKYVAAAHVCPETGNGLVHLYHWWSFTPFYKLAMPEPVAPLVVTPDGSWLFAGGVSGQIHSISIPSGDIILSVAAHSKPITCLEMHEDGSLIFCASDDGSISAFPLHLLVDSSSCEDPGRSSALQRFIGHESSITAITTSTGRSSLALISCSLDSTCKLWSLMQSTPLFSIPFPCPIWELKMDALESEFHAAGSDGFVYRGELKTASRERAKQGLQIKKWDPKQDVPLTCMTTLFLGQYIVTASEEGSMCFWNAGNGELIKFLDKEQTGRISHMVVLRGLNDRSNAPSANKMNRNPPGFHRWDLEVLARKEQFEFEKKKKMEMKEELAVSVMDRKIAVDTLELALGSYERLLRLILKEVVLKTGGASTSNTGAEDDESQKKPDV